MTVQHRLMTVEEFWEQYAGQPYELINGEVVKVVATGYLHGAVVRRVMAHLGEFVDANRLGDVVGGETGFWLSPTTLRAADVAFFSAEKLATVTEPQKYLPFVPDLAVEVVSPTDTAMDIQGKVGLYLRGGTKLVWVIYPHLPAVVVHYPDGTSKMVPGDGVLDGEGVLRGLQIPVSDLFPPDKTTEDA